MVLVIPRMASKGYNPKKNNDMYRSTFFDFEHVQKIVLWLHSLGYEGTGFRALACL
jgi:hypothetical protein